MIIPRWRDMRGEIEAADLPYKNDVLRKVDKRLAIQTTDIHHAAYLLSCQLDEPEQTIEEWIATARFCNTHVPSLQLFNFWRQFAEFTDRRGVFAHTELWSDDIRFKPQSFWMLAGRFGVSELAELAGRLAITPANSVPSERSFSAMNYIQNSFRACMSTSTTTDLCLIYINSKGMDCRPELLSEEYRCAQVFRRSERLAAHNNQQQTHRLMIDEIRRIEVLDSATIDDLIEEAAAVIPVATSALPDPRFPEEGPLSQAQSQAQSQTQPQPSNLPPWVRLPSQQHQQHLHLDPEHHPTRKQAQSRKQPIRVSKKRKTRHETPLLPS